MPLLNDGVASLSSYSTVVVVASGHPNVAVKTPGGSPRVLDDPVVSVPGEHAALGAVAND